MRLNQTEAAELFRVTPRTIQRWEDRGLPRAGDGSDATYEAADIVAWRLEDERRRAEREMGAPDAWDEARTDRMRSLARLAQLEAAERERHLVPVDQYEAEMGVVLDLLRGQLMAAPGTYAPLLQCGCRPIAKTAALLREATNEILKALQQSEPEPIERTGDDAERDAA